MNRFNNIANELLANRNEQGFWEGELSSSALGVAVSIIAFHFYDPEILSAEINRGIDWLVYNQNADGGFGDSPESLSNISTSLLCYSAIYVTNRDTEEIPAALLSLSKYLFQAGIDVKSKDIAKHVLEFYQKDYTFSVPILTTCALCGIPDGNAFKPIPQLPFELALLPRGFYRFLNLNVVSYAIPALVAVGIAIFKNKPSGRIIKSIRKRSVTKVLSLLDRIAPDSGGFLEAIPLTAFVSLSLIKSGFRNHSVVENGIAFLKRTQRPDGSWPIDIDLSTWVTTLAVKSFQEKITEYINDEGRSSITQHLLSNQNKTTHPFNGSSPGGWGWTNFSGSVPDGDDTPGAILALLRLNPDLSTDVWFSILRACDWLLKLQNSDGGFPTFSRGWGKLPFDQSCADLTGHAVVALATVIEKLGNGITPRKRKKYKASVIKAIYYLEKEQKPNGSWLPLWFGNQNHPDKHNPVYGTARVATYLSDTLACSWLDEKQKLKLGQMFAKAQEYLMDVQNDNGSWGGDKNIPGTIEETSLAISALSTSNLAKDQCQFGLQWLEQQEIPLKAAPIGLYFASLWYSEKLYPQVMYLEAMIRMKNPNE